MNLVVDEVELAECDPPAVVLISELVREEGLCVECNRGLILS